MNLFRIVLLQCFLFNRKLDSFFSVLMSLDRAAFKHRWLQLVLRYIWKVGVFRIYKCFLSSSYKKKTCKNYTEFHFFRFLDLFWLDFPHYSTKTHLLRSLVTSMFLNSSHLSVLSLMNSSSQQSSSSKHFIPLVSRAPSFVPSTKLTFQLNLLLAISSP
jgi:hypothetical protein